MSNAPAAPPKWFMQSYEDSARRRSYRFIWDNATNAECSRLWNETSSGEHSRAGFRAGLLEAKRICEEDIGCGTCCAARAIAARAEEEK